MPTRGQGGWAGLGSDGLKPYQLGGGNSQDVRIRIRVVFNKHVNKSPKKGWDDRMSRFERNQHSFGLAVTHG